MPLCEICKDILQGNPWGEGEARGKPKRHHISVASLLKSVDEKCFVCLRAFRTFDGHVQGWLSKAVSGIANELSPTEREQDIPITGLIQPPVVKPRLDAVTTLELFVNAAISTVNIKIFPLVLKKSLSSLGESHGQTWSSETVSRVQELEAQLSIYARAQNPDDHMFYLNGVIPLSMTGKSTIRSLHIFYPKETVLDTERQSAMTTDSTSSEETFSKISILLAKCSSKHPICNQMASKIRDNRWFPTRLVEVVPCPERGIMAAQLTCRIVQGSNIPIGQKYITLSHRWGTSNPVRLTTDNLASWMKEVPSELLSQTFRDSFEVANRLGVTYIWIDSLCIIQEGDDYADWKVEAPKMYQVYANAFFNISANWGSEGLFFARDPRELNAPEVTVRIASTAKKDTKNCIWDMPFALYNWVAGNESIQPPTEIKIPSVLFDTNNWENDVGNSPLSTRAWVVQERVLSPRNIHFCHNEVFFECWEGVWSETSPGSIRAMAGSSDYHLAFKDIHEDLKQSSSPSSSTPDSTHRYFKAWQQILVEYSACQLTFSSDKLIAIVGIVKFFKVLMPSETYIAGLWLSRLPWDMLWYCDFENDQRPVAASTSPSTSPARYRAPSFSWASVDVPLEWRTGIRLRNIGVGISYQKRTILPTMVEFVKYRSSAAPHIEEPVIEDIFGPIASPLVEVKAVGRLKRIQLRRFGQGVCGIKATSIGSSVRPHGDGWAYLDYQVPEADEAALMKNEMFFMPWSDSNDGTWDETEGLLLELVDAEMGRFRRVGVHCFRRWYVGRDQVTELDPDEVYIATQDGEDALPCSKFDAINREHTIFIV